ncbi:MAG: DEAD/DEAH box helicase [Actinobacteria bacterium]|nr:DEAD/DEAH box helicase [Actinomycetota bacterium]
MSDGSSVLVAAPTGAGKTVVGEFAAWLALRGGGKTFYTTPIKALSNQKYGDFVELHGAAQVGLLTGDNSINGDAPIVVMTTEVLRNMIYEDSPALGGLRYVVLDEVHYLQNPYRGAVWEEILIHLPVDVLTVSLSATVSNAEEFGEWVQTLRGRTEVVIEEHRPVEIRHWYFVADELLPMFIRRAGGKASPNPRAREYDRGRRRGGARPERGGRRPKRPRIPRRSDVVDRLSGEGMLPAIYFIFSRKGCDEAVRQCLREAVTLTSGQERREINEHAYERVADLSPGELDILGFAEWLDGLSNGIAAHHAGMIPPFKEIVEELFSRNLVKVVFATETLALGINMPARTVVVESLMKFTGERHEQMTPGEYTQLSGRAGRRGIDELGHSVVLMQRFVQFEAITRLASTRTYPLRSSFQPSYNMAVNLVRNYNREESEHLVNSSLAQWQTDRDVVRLEQARERSAAYLASYRERLECDRGDFDEYARLWEQVRSLEGRAGNQEAAARRRGIQEAVDGLRKGDVLDIPTGKKRGRYAVLQILPARSERAPRIVALSGERTVVRFSSTELREPPAPVGRIEVPSDFTTKSSRARRELARQLSQVNGGGRSRASGPAETLDQGELGELRRRLESHPCHRCPELGRHLHFLDRAARLEREVTGMDRRIHRRTGTLARRFNQVLEVLEQLGYVAGWQLTGKGKDLTGVYNESDLLVVEALEQELFDELSPSELAAVCSTLVFETRGPESEAVADMPTKASAQAWAELMSLWAGIHNQERERGLELTREPDPGFARRAHQWAAGAPLEDVLGADDAPGDFVRSTKQLIDLLRQLAEIAPGTELEAKIRTALEGLQRGVVAYSSLDL